MTKPPVRNSEGSERKSEVPLRNSTSVDELYIEFLSKRAHEYGMSDDNLSDQRSSFVIGSATLTNSDLTRSSISEIDRSAHAPKVTGGKAAVEVENLAKQYDFVIGWVQRFLSSSKESFCLDAALIREIHRISFDGVSIDAGAFRRSPIIVSNSTFNGPSADEIPNLVEQLCNYVNQNWTTSSALHLGAYVLWRLLWIHPFSDGNGRVARALCYLVLSAKLGAVLPGTPTLPELIAQNRTDYYAALEAADKAERSNIVDVSNIEEFIGRLLILQLQNIAFLPISSKAQLDLIIDSRILRASTEMRKACYNTDNPEYRLWSHGPYLALQVGAAADIRASRERQFASGDPFPSLLATERDSASQVVDLNKSGKIFQRLDLDISKKQAFFALPDTSFGLAAVTCESDRFRYLIDGALYCVRLGPRTTIENCHEAFGFLIARHMRANS